MPKDNKKQVLPPQPQPPKPISFQEFVNNLRSQIVLGYESGKEASLRSFDIIVQRLDEQLALNEALKNTLKEKRMEPPAIKEENPKKRNK